MTVSRTSTIESVPISTLVDDGESEHSTSGALRPDFQVAIDQVTEGEWNSFLSQFADASLYQTWAYGAVSWGERSLSHLLLRRAGQVVGMAQFRIMRVPLLSSGIAYLRWGPLWRRRDSAPDPGVLTALL